MTAMNVNIQHVCKDIKGLADSIGRRWNSRRPHRDITWGLAGDAQHITSDMAALYRVIEWALNHPAACGRKCHAAASRLHVALSDIAPEQWSEIRLQFRIAALCVVRTLVQQPDGHWTRGPIKEMYA